MKFLNFITFSILIIDVNLEPTSRYISYNSSDLSYLSNGIQFPVPLTIEKEAKIEMSYNETASDMEWLRNLYNHLHWDKQLRKISEPSCMKDLSIYISELKNGTSWAAKMYDASGRYSSKFFFGNDFWLGSKTLCQEISNPESNLDLPPFSLRFHVAKIRIYINEIYTPVTRQILIGQCLPASCNSLDIRSVFLQEKSKARSLIVVDIRAVPGDYSILSDRKFHIVGGTALTVFVLIVVATIVEIVFCKKKYKKRDEEYQNNNNEHLKEVPKDIPKRSKALELLLSFSALGNGAKILAFYNPSADSIRCVHGLRFFSIVWIIMVHTYLEVFSIGENKTYRTLTERSFLYQTISNATFSVDTFFFISGLVVTITYFRSATKKDAVSNEDSITAFKNSTLKFLLLIFYRFIRLTPAYLFVIGVNELVLRYTYDKSVYSPAIIDHITCDLFWWRNALYINNFYPQQEFCMLWSWYIANDTQFYVLASLCLIIAVRGERHLRWIGGSVIVFLFTSWVTTFWIAMKFNYVARVEEPFALFDQLYDKPWMRIGPYLIGMLTGYLLFKKEKCKIPKGIPLVAWILSLSCLLSLVYGFGRNGLVIPLSAIYAALGHTAWGISIAWITVACCWGYGGPIDTLLGFKGFLPLSRLTYCAYLIHPVIMVYTSLLMDGPMHLHQSNVIIVFLGNTAVSFMAAFLISMAFEAPIVRLLKIIFSPNSKDKE